jgi:hypothetical protein
MGANTNNDNLPVTGAHCEESTVDRIFTHSHTLEAAGNIFSPHEPADGGPRLDVDGSDTYEMLDLV